MAGAKAAWTGNSTLSIDCTDVDNGDVPEHPMRRMRSSFIVVGPLLGRLGRVRPTYPGGCAIGTRAIDLHLMGLSTLGARITPTNSGYIEFQGRKAAGGTQIDLISPASAPLKIS